MDIKPARTIDEQLQILKAKGLLVSDEQRAKDILFSINYYVFSGYLFDFKNSEGKCINVDFDKVYNIYQCDKRIKSILLYAIEIIEHNLKTKLAYTLAHTAGSLSYLDKQYFVNVYEHNKMLDKFEKSVNNNNGVPFVKHHIVKYDGLFPVWVAVELFTLGMVWNCFKNLKTPYRKNIAKHFNTGITQLESWIECTSYIRNLAAHNMRLYNYNIQKTPKHAKKKFDNFTQSNKIYDIVYIMKFLMPDNKEWNNFILPTIASIFEEYKEYINLSCYGFPQNWDSALKIN